MNLTEETARQLITLLNEKDENGKKRDIYKEINSLNILLARVDERLKSFNERMDTFEDDNWTGEDCAAVKKQCREEVNKELDARWNSTKWLFGVVFTMIIALTAWFGTFNMTFAQALSKLGK